MLLPIIAALTNSIEIMFDKVLLSRQKLGTHTFLRYSWIIITILMILLSPLFFKITPEMFLLKNIILMIVILITAVGYNYSLFWALKHEHVEKVETLSFSTWIFAIVMALIFFPIERNIINILLAAIAIITLVSINIKKHHLQLNKYSYAIIFAGLLIATHDIIVKQLMTVYSPLMFYFVRSTIIASILLFIKSKSKKKIENKSMYLLIILNILVVFENVLKYWSYSLYGIVFTSIFMTFAPMIAIILSNLILKEKIHKKYFFGSAVLTSCIIISVFL